MTERLFNAGDEGEQGGVRWRVRQGRKGPEDLVLDLEGRQGFAPVKMALAALLVSFFYENEERLYPRAYGYQGGGYFLNFIRDALRRGWVAASQELEASRRRRQGREAA